MEFCETCDNMLYTKIVDDSESSHEDCQESKAKSGLIYFCKNCGKEYNTKGKTVKIGCWINEITTVRF